MPPRMDLQHRGGCGPAPGGLAPFPPHDEARWATVRSLRDDANRALAAARRDKILGASLDGSIRVAPPEDAEKRAAFLDALAPLRGAPAFEPHGGAVDGDVDDLRLLLLVSALEFVDDAAGVRSSCADEHVVSSAESLTGATVGASLAGAPRCARCWYHDGTVGASAAHPALCARCDAAVAEK